MDYLGGNPIKPLFFYFLWGFDPVNLNAPGGFFSQITQMMKTNVCGDFEENRRGRPIDRKIWNPYNFFPI